MDLTLRRFFRKPRASQGSPDALPPLQDTGERVIPEESRTGFARINFVRHKVAHLYAIRRVRGSKRVLDVGCGTGYGSAMVASRVGEVVGIDSSEEAVVRAKVKHRLDNLEFVTMPATELSFPDGSFDAAYSIQVIEHIEDVELHLSEVARVLRPGGRFVVATPNRLTYSPDGLHNAFHVREYDAGELEILLASFFPEVEITGLHAALDLALRPEVQDYEFSARIKALRAALKDEELQRFMEEWLVEDGFEGFDAEAVGPHSFPISPKSIDTSLDLLATCRKA
jgi:2-polyprenyl-3-methyl-5-hydroxy-6-metoxy-1,4-benzoquinol methylase